MNYVPLWHPARQLQNCSVLVWPHVHNLTQKYVKIEINVDSSWRGQWQEKLFRYNTRPWVASSVKDRCIVAIQD